MLKYNIEIRGISFGWEEFKTQCLKYGRQKSIPDLEKRLKDIIENKRVRWIPLRPEVPIPDRTDMGILRQITHQLRSLDYKAVSKTSDSDKVSRYKWNINEEKGVGIMHQLLKDPDPPKIDESLLGSRIEYLSEFGLYDER